MKTFKRILAVLVLILSFSFQKASAHCEVPCGIYGDSIRIELLKEHVGTIEKGMQEIVAYGNESTVNYNQMVRWVNNKEEHANEIQHIMTQYFLFQRVKPSNDKVTQKKNAKLLDSIHRICVLAMKAKQSTDTEITHKLFHEIENFETLYFAK